MLSKIAILFFILLVSTSYVIGKDLNKPIKVFVSIAPQKFLVEKIGGERVDVSVMVKTGQNPETYEPTPRQMAELEKADLYFRIAVPFEDVWIDRIAANNNKLKIIGCCDAINIHGTDHEQQNDLHVWTSPGNAKILAKIISDALIETDSGHSGFYEEHYQELLAELTELDRYIKTKLQGLKNRYIVVVHPAWGYFTDAYDLEQISVERHGVEVRAKTMTELVDFIRNNHIKQLYTQKQFSSGSIKMLASETGARLVELDPLAENYIDNLRHVADCIASAGIKQ